MPDIFFNQIMLQMGCDLTWLKVRTSKPFWKNNRQHDGTKGGQKCRQISKQKTKA